jgi:hypothetical protein
VFGKFALVSMRQCSVKTSLQSSLHQAYYKIILLIKPVTNCDFESVAGVAAVVILMF